MRVIGLTGGVGSGKSYVAHYLEEHGQMELLVADELGHMAMAPGTESFRQIVARFGEQLLCEDGSLNRDKIAEIVFWNPSAMEDLNAIIHPVVKSYIAAYIRERQECSGTILLESAILYETGCEQLCDEVWYVHVPEELRICRLCSDRGYTEEKSRAIITRQQPERFFLEHADRVIENAGTKQDLEKVLESMIPAQ